MAYTQNPTRAAQSSRGAPPSGATPGERSRRSGATAKSEIAIFGGDPLVGGALERALRNAGYGARFLDPTLADEPAGLLNGDKLVLLGPRLGAEAKKKLLLAMRSVPDKAEVPVLELVAALDGLAEGPVVRVAWPCRMEDLLRKIEAALPEGPSADGSTTR